jgi:Holliday junction resolvasome RuvABC DNA-binding subunit
MEDVYLFDGIKKRKATASELVQFEKDRLEAEQQKRLLKAAEQEKKEKRESAVNKLKALGLTDEEVDALIP